MKKKKVGPGAKSAGKAGDRGVQKRDRKNRSKCCIAECDRLAEVNEYCRLHYIMHWNRIKKVERAEAERRLNRYIEEITRKYPTEYLEIIKKDLEDSQALESIVKDMDLEEGINGVDDIVEEKDIKNIYNNLKIDEEY